MPKIKPKKPELPRRPVDESDLSALTREVDAVTAAELVARARGSAPPPPPRRAEPGRSLDTLAQTIEAPSVARVQMMDAAEALLANVGFEALTEKAVADAANVAEEVFHAHFADKVALLRALCERFRDQAIAATNEATRTGIWDRATPREVIEVATQSILDAILGRAGLVKAVLATGDAAMLADLRSVGTRLTSSIVRVIDEIQPKDRPIHERDVAFVLFLASAMAHNLVMIGSDWSGLDFDRNDIYARLVATIDAYLDARRGS